MCATTERRQRSTSLALSENNDGIDLVLDSNKADNGSDNNNNNNNNTKTAIGIEGGNKNNNNNNIDIDIDIDTSSTFCAEMIMLPSVCEGSSNFAEQMDTFMTCRHPLDLLGTMFHEDENDDDACVDNNNNNNNEGGGSDEHNNNDNNQVRTSGYHAIPRNCEYCGSNNIDLCHTNVTENNNNNNNNNNTTKKCERPRSFFSRERPPFHPHDDTICSNGYSKWMTEKNIWLNTTINNNDADDTINKEREKEDEEHNNNSRSEDDETNITDKGTATTTANSTTTRRLAWI
jgi:hypothetical protein